ncbi:DUF2812 domain-containing protein [Streptococcus merionis]|uniref:Membrane protein n=1 Tax=Streptococcus merionis TaxID=400065 RepID=A0A239SVJ2_9STRE|nr:DUF2812 domain-containing protein [Streptococcus merionis]SNU89525.1 membrane protein [Streptococcus merionis]
MRKYNLFADPSQEEVWINDVQSQGYQLVKVVPWLFCYDFEPSNNPKKVRIDYWEFYTTKRLKQYQAFFDDAGWESVAGGLFGGQQYFKQKADTSDEEIFSDKESRLAMQKRILDMALSAAFISFFYVSIMLSYKGVGLADYFVPSRWFLTQGIWQMPKNLLWKAVLFELPFALLRILPFYFFVGSTFFYFYRYIKLSKIIKNET